MNLFLEKVIALFLLALSLPIVIMFALAIRCASRGPFVIRLTREGLGCRPFPMTKLRTMSVDAEQRLATILLEANAQQEWRNYGRFVHDPRIAGRAAIWARRLSVDELPQLWDVVCGRMSLVGPRPLPRHTADLIPARWRARRATVKPGMTGLWQVSGRADVDLRRMVALDLAYIRHQSLSLDIAILLRTPWKVFSGEGAY